MTKSEITGYTQPNQKQIDMVNKIKAHEISLGELYRELLNDSELEVDQRCLALAKTRAQEAYMWFNRSVFKPKDVF